MCSAPDGADDHMERKSVTTTATDSELSEQRFVVLGVSFRAELGAESPLMSDLSWLVHQIRSWTS